MDEQLSATQEIQILAAAYDTGTQRINSHFEQLSDLEIPDRYAGQIDLWFDACDLLTIEVLPPLPIHDRLGSEVA